MAHAHPTWPAAVSPLSVGVLQGPERPARVLGAFPTALYLGEGDEDPVLPVLTIDALRLPTGLLLGRRSTEVDWGVRAGGSVVVGGGRVRLPGHEVIAVRTLRPARIGGATDPWALPDRPVAPAVVAQVATERVDPVQRDFASDLVRSALAGLGVGRAVEGLVGAGRGLTPSGDDVLCGVLLSLRGAGGGSAREAHRAIATSVRGALHRTTSLSASFLLAAEQGYAVPAVVRLVSLLTHRAPEPLEDALEQVLSIGHSSGADLVAGITGTLSALAEDPAPSRPDQEPTRTQEGTRRA